MQRRLNILLLSVLTAGLLVAGVTFSAGELSRVEAEELERAGLLMDLANVTRLYTNDEVRPLFAYQGEGFHKPMVPSYASRRITEALLQKPGYEGYSIREAALAPINVDDRADEWEAGLIRVFKDREPLGGYSREPGTPISGVRERPDGPVFFLAEPIVVPPEVRFGCLICHGAREHAPPAMVAAYPGAAGFGWTEGEVVGVQVVTVPMRLGLEHRRERLLSLLLSLLAVFTLIYAATNQLLVRQFLRPLVRITSVADAASRGEEAPWLDESLPGEQGRLAASINRLRRSHDKALELADRADDPGPRGMGSR